MSRTTIRLSSPSYVASKAFTPPNDLAIPSNTLEIKSYKETEESFEFWADKLSIVLVKKFILTSISAILPV
jgi:hypothetical protein